LAIVLATPAFAAKLYLKDGGVIQAKKVWREGGRVHVWITRDTMTSFGPSEVDLKRTFVKRHRAVKKVAAVQPQTQTTAAAPNGAAADQKTVEKKAGITLPKLPKLPEKTPDSLVPSSGGGGAIKQHKKEMAEKTGE
jgi:hypothetical protein